MQREKKGGREGGREGRREGMHLDELPRHDGLLVLLAKIEGAMVERLVVILLQQVLPSLVQVLGEGGREGGGMSV